MNEIQEKLNIKDMIYVIRDKQVMLDSDLAKLYECKNGTKTINQAVKRNIEKFPDDFYFQLTDEEYRALRFQNGISNRRGGRRYNPYMFTEQGVAMLATIDDQILYHVGASLKKCFAISKMDNSYIKDILNKL